MECKVLTFVSVVQIYWTTIVNWCAQRGMATICLASISISSGTSNLRSYLEKQMKIKTGLCKKRVILIAQNKLSGFDSHPKNSKPLMGLEVWVLGANISGGLPLELWWWKAASVAVQSTIAVLICYSRCATRKLEN